MTRAYQGMNPYDDTSVPASRQEGVRSDPTININNSLEGLKLQVQSTSERTRGERNRNEILSSIGRRAYRVLDDLSSTVLINPVPNRRMQR